MPKKTLPIVGVLSGITFAKHQPQSSSDPIPNKPAGSNGGPSKKPAKRKQD